MEMKGRFVLLGLAGVLAGMADLVVYPEYPAQIARDYAYGVCVVQGGKKAALPVYNHTEQSILNGRTRGGDVNRRFCEFAFDGEPVRVDVRVAEDVACYKVFPARLNLKTAFKDGVISVWLDRPCYWGLQLNDYDKTILSVFADRPEDPAVVPARDKPGCLYVDGWLDATREDGVLEPGADVSEIYLAPGSVLNARLLLRRPKMFVHGRGMVLDPMSDVFRFDQTKNTARGLVRISGAGTTVDGIKLVDARTFNICSWANDVTLRNVKLLASMMCSDGFTMGGSGFRAENAWIYVGDNALVVSGAKGATFRDIVLGTSCAAIFPQGNNAGIVMENVDVFRADDGLINNWYNAVLRRNTKWRETTTQMARKEPGPQDLNHLSHEFFFRNLSAVDCTLFSHFFSGRNMGTRPKTFGFEGVSIPPSTGKSDWRAIGKTDGVAIDTRNDPKKWLVTDNYALTFTNLWVGGVRAEFPASAFNNPQTVRVSYATTADGGGVPTAPNRVVVGWTCPYKRSVGHFLLRDVRTIDGEGGERRLPAEAAGANLLVDATAVKSIWQRVPSWLVKFEATGRENGARLYRLVQCERGAGIQAVVTDRFLRQGNGTYRLAFDVKATSEKPLTLTAKFLSNEKSFARKLPVPSDGAWRHFEVDFTVDFDLAVTELAALALTGDTPADEIIFKNFSFSRQPLSF
ncbi:MAG: hypothetical protein ACI4Q3_01825 [Kiritimatiellia bacterium]